MTTSTSGNAPTGYDSDDLGGRYIQSQGPPLTQDQVDAYDSLWQAQSRSDERRNNRRLRLIYAGAMLALFFMQIVAVNAFAFLIGFGIIEVDRWVATTFVGGTLGQVSGMTVVVLRYLFPSRMRDNE